MTGETYSLPMVALRGLTILPEEVRHFDVSREKLTAGNRRGSKKSDRNYSSALRKIWKPEEPGAEDVYLVGCVVTIRQVVKFTEENESCTCIRRSKSKSCKTGQ